MSSGRVIEFAAAALAALMSCASVDAAEMPLPMVSGEARRTYIEPLHLEGKEFREVLGTLLGEGFRCSVHDGTPDILDDSQLMPADLKCSKDGTSIHERCEILIVHVLPADAQLIKAAELLRAFDHATAKEVGTFCWAKPRVPAETRERFEQNRPAAEAKLAERMKPLNATAKMGAPALYELLERGYACGVEPSEIACTVRSSDTRCVQEKTVITLERSTLAPSAKPLDDLDKTVVRNQKNSCEIPF